jgi:hypothetical protein
MQDTSSTEGGGRSGGLRYAPNITGKYLFRIRETHVRDHYGPLIRNRGT